MTKKRIIIAAICGAAAIVLIVGAAFGINGAVNSPARLLNLGEKYLLEIDYEKAVVYFERVIEIEPKNVRAYIALAEAYDALGEINKSIRTLRLGLKRTDNDEIAAYLATLEADKAALVAEKAKTEKTAEAALDDEPTQIVETMPTVESAPPPSSAPATDPDYIHAMSASEYENLNKFFDIFTDLNYLYAIDSDSSIVTFAINWYDGGNNFSFSVPKEFVEETARRYFGVEKIVHEALSGYDPEKTPAYNNGYYGGRIGTDFLNDAWYNVSEMVDNGDSTYTAKVDCYYDATYEFGMAESLNGPENKYGPVSSWTLRSGQTVVDGSGSSSGDYNIHRIYTSTVVLRRYSDSWQVVSVNGYNIPKTLFADDAAEDTSATASATQFPKSADGNAQQPDYITIKGEQYSTALTELKLENMKLTNQDIEPLKYMTNLTSLVLKDNQISDISALKGLTNLTYLNLGINQISDISALKGLTNLTYLALWDNQISDISALSGLTNLTPLYLSNNQISDISALSGLTNLTTLGLDENQISDISTLKSLTNLRAVSLSNNRTIDISALKELTNLDNLNLGGNQISDISALNGLTNLSFLYLGGNQISDISALKGLTNLTTLYLSDNQIRDWSPVSHVANVDGRPQN